MTKKLASFVIKIKFLILILPFLFVLPVIAFTQDSGTKITGKVLDENGKPLQSVSVNVKGSSIGTATDANGNFSVTIPGKKATFVFSYVGYVQKEVRLGGNSSNVIVLQSKEASLEQVVVVGYGTEKKVNLTGAVDQIGGEALEDRPMPNVARGLEGALAGVFVNMPTGSPTQDFSPMVRGMGSIGAGGSALVLIDGVPGELNTLNPADIKSISVLKDAAASAIYGARGAFGVVLVTTRNPQSGQVELNYSFNYSLNTRAVKPELLTDGYLWAKNFDEAYYQWSYSLPTTINTGMTFSQDYLEELKKLNEQGALPKIDVDPSTGKYIYYGSSDWQKLLFDDNNPSMQHQLSLSGGNKEVNYYLSGRLFQQHGIFNYSPDKFKQYNIRGKGSFQVFPWLKMGSNFSYSQRSYFYPLSVRSPNTNILRRLTDEFNPLSFFQNPDGTLTKSAALTFGSFLTGGNFTNEQWKELRNSFDLEAGFFNDELKINGNFSYIYKPYLEEQRATPVPYSEKPDEILLMDINQDYAGETTHRENYLGANLFASYEHSFGKHNIKVLAGYNYENTDLIIRHYRRNNMINSSLPDPGLLTGEDIQLTGGGYEWTTSGEFFRVNYNFKEKYLLEINGRYDGSSKFPVDQQFGFFPSASAGWRISNESFWKVSPNFISNLKLRASLGSLGNGNVSPYRFLETMPVNLLNRVIEGVKPLYTNDPNVIPNGLTWEKATTANIGLDAGFLNNRLLLNFDIYRRSTVGMFTQGVSLPSAFGAAVPKGNYADMRTPGWELTIAWNNQGRGEHPIRYSVRFHLSDNYSVVERFNNPEGLIEEYYVGKRLGDMWGYEMPGLYQTQAQLDKAPNQTMVYVTSRDKNRLKLGDPRFIDQNGDGKIDYGTLTLDNKGDLIKIGNSQPRYLFGLNGNVEWNNFSLSIFFQGIGKRDWWPGSENWLFWGQFNRPYTSMPVDVNNQIYSPENPNADGSSVSDNSIPVIRYAEVLLNYAEAKAELGSFTQGDWDATIKKLRERAGITNSSMPTTADQYLEDTYYAGISDPVILEIRRERAIELALEGFRYNDLLRWKLGKNLEMPWVGMYVPKMNVLYDLNEDGKPEVSFVNKVPGNKEPGVVYRKVDDVVFKLSEGDHGNIMFHTDFDRTWEDKKYYYPIPRQEIVLNSNLEQNSGWE